MVLAQEEFIDLKKIPFKPTNVQEKCNGGNELEGNSMMSFVFKHRLRA
jgi:hypothetical protein